MFRHAILALGALLGAISLSSGDVEPVASPQQALLVSDRTLTDSTGKPHAPLANRGQKATVMVFLMHDCPVTNTTAPELNRLFRAFGERGVDFFRIYSTETAEDIERHSREFGLAFPGLRDPALHFARLTGATRAPEAVVIAPSGELLYRGRIDDRAVKPGVTRPAARQRDLFLALEAILAGKQPEPRYTPAVGCYLAFDDGSASGAGATASELPRGNRP